MLTLAQLQQHLQETFRVIARQAGRDSEFIQRQRKLNGESFASSVVWGYMANPQASLAELSQAAALCGVNISPQGLAQRMTASAAECLRQVLEASLVMVACGGEGSATFLEQFNGVYLLDSTEVPLPIEWEPQCSGGGNQHQRRAAMKVQTLWDYQGGSLHFSLHPARRHDVALPVPPCRRVPFGSPTVPILTPPVYKPYSSKVVSTSPASPPKSIASTHRAGNGSFRAFCSSAPPPISTVKSI